MRTLPPPSAGVPTHPPDILVTTPESLFLLLSSTAREPLVGVRTVIVDEVHAVAGTKRGAHLALSLARLDAQLGKPAQRIGLSTTARPVEEVSTFLASEQPVKIVRPANRKSVRLPVTGPGRRRTPGLRRAAGPAPVAALGDGQPQGHQPRRHADGADGADEVEAAAGAHL